jgi:hypothetical protein
MRVRAKMESPFLRKDLRFTAALPPFRDSLKHGYEKTASFSLGGIPESVLFRVFSYGVTVSGHNHNPAIKHLPGIRFYVGELLCGFIPVQADHPGWNQATGAD